MFEKRFPSFGVSALLVASYIAAASEVGAQPRPIAFVPDRLLSVQGKIWKKTRVRTFPRGEGDGQLGISTPVEHERRRGPNAIAISQGKVLVVDGENERAIELDDHAQRTAIRIQRARSITDVVYSAGRFVAFDASRERLIRFDRQGRVGDIDTPPIRSFSGLVNLSARRIAVRTTSQVMEVELDANEQPARPTRPRALPTLSPTERKIRMVRGSPIDSLRSIITSRRSAKAGRISLIGGTAGTTRLAAVDVRPPVPGELGAFRHLGTDKQGRIYLLIEVLVSKNPIGVKRFIRIVSPSLQTLDELEIPLEDVILPDKDIAIDDDGTIAILFPYAEVTKILFISPT